MIQYEQPVAATVARIRHVWFEQLSAQLLRWILLYKFEPVVLQWQLMLMESATVVLCILTAI